MGDMVTLNPRQVTTDEYFGGCPECGKSDGYLNVGRNHWGVCDTHKTTWPIGANLFSSWHDETEAEWQQNEERLATYSIVEPIRPEPTEEDRRHKEEHKAWRAECQRIDKGFGVVCGPDGVRAIEPGENPLDALDEVACAVVRGGSS